MAFLLVEMVVIVPWTLSKKNIAKYMKSLSRPPLQPTTNYKYRLGPFVRTENPKMSIVYLLSAFSSSKIDAYNQIKDNSRHILTSVSSLFAQIAIVKLLLHFWWVHVFLVDVLVKEAARWWRSAANEDEGILCEFCHFMRPVYAACDSKFWVGVGFCAELSQRSLARSLSLFVLCLFPALFHFSGICWDYEST